MGDRVYVLGMGWGGVGGFTSMGRLFGGFGVFGGGEGTGEEEDTETLGLYRRAGEYR